MNWSVNYLRKTNYDFYNFIVFQNLQSVNYARYKEIQHKHYTELPQHSNDGWLMRD